MAIVYIGVSGMYNSRGELIAKAIDRTTSGYKVAKDKLAQWYAKRYDNMLMESMRCIGAISVLDGVGNGRSS